MLRVKRICLAGYARGRPRPRRRVASLNDRLARSGVVGTINTLCVVGHFVKTGGEWELISLRLPFDLCFVCCYLNTGAILLSLKMELVEETRGMKLKTTQNAIAVGATSWNRFVHVSKLGARRRRVSSCRPARHSRRRALAFLSTS